MSRGLGSVQRSVLVGLANTTVQAVGRPARIATAAVRDAVDEFGWDDFPSDADARAYLKAYLQMHLIWRWPPEPDATLHTLLTAAPWVDVQGLATSLGDGEASSSRTESVRRAVRSLNGELLELSRAEHDRRRLRVRLRRPIRNT